MKTIDCKDCGGQVSKNATGCPHCGSKHFSLRRSLDIWANQLVWLCIIGAVLFFLFTSKACQFN